MARRSMKQITPLCLALSLVALQYSTLKAQLDQYGGWKNIKVQARGFFYITQINSRYTFITPEGHAYYAVGINHLNGSNSERYSHLEDFQTDRGVLRRINEDLAFWNMNNAGDDCPGIVQDQMPFFLLSA